MLVMLDAIHEAALDVAAATGADAAAAWTRLSDRDAPKIWFLFLPVADLDRGEDLYLKMNSRGKPLTKFEVLKADLEDALKTVLTTAEHERITRSFDGGWTDVFWEYEKASRKARAAAEEALTTPPPKVTVDDAFMRYLGFLVEVCEWRDREPGTPVERRRGQARAHARGTRAARLRRWRRSRRTRQGQPRHFSSTRSTRGAEGRARRAWRAPDGRAPPVVSGG